MQQITILDDVNAEVSKLGVKIVTEEPAATVVIDENTKVIGDNLKVVKTEATTKDDLVKKAAFLETEIARLAAEKVKVDAQVVEVTTKLKLIETERAKVK